MPCVYCGNEWSNPNPNCYCMEIKPLTLIKEEKTMFNITVNNPTSDVFNVKIETPAGDFIEIPTLTSVSASYMAQAIADAINNFSATENAEYSDDVNKPCEHEWVDGFDMAGPTRHCKKCGKFERD